MHIKINDIAYQLERGLYVNGDTALFAQQGNERPWCVSICAGISVPELIVFNTKQHQELFDACTAAGIIRPVNRFYKLGEHYYPLVFIRGEKNV